MKQSKSDLLDHLRDQIYFLAESSRQFDEGEFREAKRIANTLRVLLHDTKNSKSLLGQLGLKNYRFYNSCAPQPPDDLAPYVPLLSFKFNCPLGCRPWIVPSGTPNQWPRKKKLRFSEWWNMPVIKTPKKYRKVISFCRRDIVLHVADTDGGAHVDPSLEKKYAALSKWNALGIVTEQNGLEEPIENPVMPCLRQISHELLLLLIEKNRDYVPDNYEMQISDDPPKGFNCLGVPTEAALVFPDIL